MGKKLDDIVSDIVYPVLEATGTYAYLDSACSKLIYAEKRLITLKTKVTRYKRKIDYKNGDASLADTTTIEMDLDHCLISLRSSLEHLAQLINSVIPLNLATRRTSGQMYVTLERVIEKIISNPKYKKDSPLYKLYSFLEKVIQSDWYQDLNSLRIETYHHKNQDILIPLAASYYKLDELFLLPQEVFINPKNNKEREIIYYVQNRIKDIEDVLYNCSRILKQYLSQP